MTTYELVPFSPKPERASIVSDMIRRIAAQENLFASHLPPCEASEPCVVSRPLEASCERCIARLATISRALSAPDVRVFEVWAAPPADAALVGVIYFSGIVPDGDATGHYVFFDRKLSDKTDVIEEAIGEMFEGVRRLTIEIPLPFAALARHAHGKLGFGGPFTYTLKGGVRLRVEGVKRGAVMWRGESTDLLILGRVRD